jgi:hypothetical protein
MPTFNLSREIYLARHSATFNNSMVDKTFNHSTNGSIFLSTRFTASNEEPAELRRLHRLLNPDADAVR